jgi:hypothetical protein
MVDAAVCVERGGLWVNMNQNFDQIWRGVLSLLEICTTEGWVDVMYAAVDARGAMRDPKRDSQIGFSLFFVLFIFVGSFFFLNLCVGVIVDNFTQMKEESGGALLETEAQTRWREGKRALITRQSLVGVTNLQALTPRRRFFFLLVQDSKFETFIMVCIVLNSCVMALKQFPVPEIPDEFTIKVINYAFALIFTVEAMLKIYVLRMTYFRDGWNKFDFVCVTATLTGILLDEVFHVQIGSVMSAIRLFRIARLLRLLRFAKGLNQLFVAFILSIPKLMNVGIILVLLLFLFSVMGMHMFSKTHALGPHNESAHFRTFFRAFLTLFRCMTGEGWNEIMHALAKGDWYFGTVMGEPCIPDFKITAEGYEQLMERCLIDNPVACGSPAAAEPYFVLYTCTITFVILNLFVAVVLEGFDGSAVGEEEAIVQKCIEVWMRMDTNVDMWMPVPQVQEFMVTVEAEFSENRKWKPLPKPQKKLVKDARAFVFDWLQCTNSQVSFMNATLGALMILLCQVAVNEQETLDGRGSAESLDEVQKVIKEIREISEKEGTVTSAHYPPSRTNAPSEMAALGFMEGAGGMSVDNFKEHAAALHLQRQVRWKQDQRAKAGVPYGATLDPVGKVSPSKVRVSTQGDEEEVEEVADGDKEARPGQDVSLPGQLNSDNEGMPKPAVAG